MAGRGKKQKSSETPLMRQYRKIKDRHPNAILLFRMGDFYETFEDDAILISGILGITLTKRYSFQPDSYLIDINFIVDNNSGVDWSTPTGASRWSFGHFTGPRRTKGIIFAW